MGFEIHFLYCLLLKVYDLKISFTIECKEESKKVDDIVTYTLGAPTKNILQEEPNLQTPLSCIMYPTLYSSSKQACSYEMMS